MFDEPEDDARSRANISRPLQLEILKRLRDVYPRPAMLYDVMDVSSDNLSANLLYLEEHSLCESGVSIGGDDQIHAGRARITAAGIDFLEDDGGLTAIRGVVTVRFAAETLKALLSSRVDDAEIPPEEKSRLKKQIQALPEHALKEATGELVKNGLAQMPNAISWLQTLTAGLA